MANILDVKKGIAARVRMRRREAGISQTALARRSGVSLGSIKRFEGAGEISLASLVRIAAVLGYEKDFDKLFTRRNYQSIDEIIAENRNAK
ncbi:MAG: helix-turn-helix domain-containing protein [Chitinispirillales bacterium]|jgi:transcriptional regulator with XRE-family HTH domain|nr:helix-turn-helix domain-containing protein [Chitinispirillales bacterium]